VVVGPGKTQVARTLGSEVVADRHCEDLVEDFVEVVGDVTGGRGADVIYDPDCAYVCRRSTRWLAFEGPILVVELPGGQIRSVALNLPGQELPDRRPVTCLHTTRDAAPVHPCNHGSPKLVDDGSTKPLVSQRLASDAVADGVAAPRRRDHGRQAGALVRRRGPTPAERQAVPMLEAIPSARHVELACLSSQT